MATAKKPVKKVVSRKATPASKPVVKKSTGKASVRVGSGTKKKQSLLSRLSRVQWIVVAVFILAFAGLGTYLIKSSSALSVSNYGCTTYPTLRYGSSGDCVRKLQAVLKLRWGYSLTVDGQFGSITQSKVKAFQTNQRISSDGVVGPITWGKLNQNVTYTKTVPSGSGGRVFPVSPKSSVTSISNTHPYPAVDIMTKTTGVSVLALESGRVLRFPSDVCGKKNISVYSPIRDEVVTYMHMDSRTVTSRIVDGKTVYTPSTVSAGQKLGTVGNCNGAHLHIDIHAGSGIRPTCSRSGGDCTGFKSIVTLLKNLF